MKWIAEDVEEVVNEQIRMLAMAGGTDIARAVVEERDEEEEQQILCRGGARLGEVGRPMVVRILF